MDTLLNPTTHSLYRTLQHQTKPTQTTELQPFDGRVSVLAGRKNI